MVKHPNCFKPTDHEFVTCDLAIMVDINGVPELLSALLLPGTVRLGKLSIYLPRRQSHKLVLQDLAILVLVCWDREKRSKDGR